MFFLLLHILLLRSLLSICSYPTSSTYSSSPPSSSSSSVIRCAAEGSCDNLNERLEDGTDKYDKMTNALKKQIAVNKENGDEDYVYVDCRGR